MEISKVDFKHILYTTDFSDISKFACSYAKNIAEKYNAELTLLHVIRDELTDFMIFDAGNERTPTGVSNRLSIQKEYLKEQREAIVQYIESEFGKPEVGVKNYLVENGIPSKVIARVAEEQGCDLIVMGVKGRSYVEDLVMGDTARRVITLSKIPVLVVQNQSVK
ncbi:MAG: universal stress protein [Bacteroidales bacterium]|jgi:universal stress protein A|nr:universal stress protein [Bacteroidales bacterium]